MKPNETFSPDTDLLSLESRLARTLKPVTPSSDIVHRLRGRIQLQIPSRQEITLRLSDWRRLFVVFGGVMSGMLVLLTIARAFYYMSGRRS
ncbi:MAG TPA: hypothetical protein PK414_07210 [Anaerolineales bacterium]|nr:hypothetical protein [Anaerolineales bacterium]HNC09559.1 hypothetical protein [Anaerolineales bacterium]